MTDAYPAVAAGMVVGAVAGFLISFVYSRVRSQRQAAPQPLSDGGRAAMQAFLVAYVAIVSGLLTALVIVGGLVSTLPFALVAIVAGIALMLAGPARARR